ncbi:EVE domain protein, partial [Diplocarpon rosae]
MPKRKLVDLGVEDQLRRSSRRVSTKDSVTAEEPSKSKVRKKANPQVKKAPAVNGKGDEEEGEHPKNTKEAKPSERSSQKINPPEQASTGRQFWLLKAEPESRFERGKNIKFSIDDLAAKTEPEPWDARNNLRAMKKGDLAFFYHSSCKTPAIVGTMEIVEEHTPDLTAHDPSAPYYDASSKPSDPKWSVVHVKFKQKLQTPVTLKELREWQAVKGSALENMQMLKQTRMSVSKVSAEEWAFLVGEMGKRGDVVE